jgi:hypothetical protein
MWLFTPIPLETVPMATISPLRRRMIEDMTIRNLSRSTQQSYIYAMAKFSRHFGRSPDLLGMEEVQSTFPFRAGSSLLVTDVAASSKCFPACAISLPRVAVVLEIVLNRERCHPCQPKAR